MMTKDLYNWLENKFYIDNHPKYRNYFKKWISNINNNQIEGFNNQMKAILQK